MAAHNFLAVRRVFPKGSTTHLGSDELEPHVLNMLRERRCWFHDILPFVEETALADYTALEAEQATTVYAITTEVNYDWVPIGMFMCATDPNAGKNITYTGRDGQMNSNSPLLSQGFHGNYVLCAASTVFGVAAPANYGPTDPNTNGSRLNGIAYPISATRAQEITDGLSKTLLGSEIVLVPDTNVQDDLRGRYYNTFEGNNLFTTFYPPNTPNPDTSRFWAQRYGYLPPTALPAELDRHASRSVGPQSAPRRGERAVG